MIAALLLAASGPADFAVSPFLSSDHEHNWEFLANEEAGRVWWDRSAILSHFIGNREYPTILMRVVVNEEHALSEAFQYQDVLVAVDCEGAEIAEVDQIANGQRVDDPWADVRPDSEFTPLPNQSGDAVQTMMRAVCGADWTP